jgi:DNA-binding response OmpR family regulator
LGNVADLKALLRRAQGDHGNLDRARFGAVEVDFATCEATKAGMPINLTALELSLLKSLVRRQGQVVNRRTLLDEVWGQDLYVLPKTVDTHIGHLRKRLEDDPANPRHILGVRGMGYRFTAGGPTSPELHRNST